MTGEVENFIVKWIIEWAVIVKKSDDRRLIKKKFWEKSFVTNLFVHFSLLSPVTLIHSL